MWALALVAGSVFGGGCTMCDKVDDCHPTYSGGIVGSWVYTGGRAGSAYGGHYEGAADEVVSDEVIVEQQPLRRGPSGY
jgi:hypothetical protein